MRSHNSLMDPIMAMGKMMETMTSQLRSLTSDVNSLRSEINTLRGPPPPPVATPT